jgi:hypothetical protein
MGNKTLTEYGEYIKEYLLECQKENRTIINGNGEIVKEITDDLFNCDDKSLYVIPLMSFGKPVHLSDFKNKKSILSKIKSFTVLPSGTDLVID